MLRVAQHSSGRGQVVDEPLLVLLDAFVIVLQLDLFQLFERLGLHAAFHDPRALLFLNPPEMDQLFGLPIDLADQRLHTIRVFQR